MRLFSLSFGLFFSLLVSGQNNPWHGHFIPFGLGSSQGLQLDRFHSPLHYRSWAGQIQSGYLFQNERWQSTFYLMGGAGIARANLDAHPGRVFFINAQAHYSLRYAIWSRRQQHFFLGLSNQNAWNYDRNQRFNNGSESYAGWFGIGPSLAYQQAFQFPFWPATSFGWQSSLELPLSSLVIRPQYSGARGERNIGRAAFDLWGDFFQLQLRHEWIYFLKNGNRLSLTYFWDYAQTTVERPRYQGQHYLVLSTYFAL